MKPLPLCIFTCVSKVEAGTYSMHVHVCVHLLVYVVGQIKRSALSGLWNALHTTDDMKWPLRSTGITPN